MRIVENALSISPLFFLFFSLPPPRPPRLSGTIFLFFERRGLLSSRLFQGDEIFIFFLFRGAHTAINQKSVFRLGRPEIGFRNFELPLFPLSPLYFIRLPPRTEAPKILSLTNE